MPVLLTKIWSIIFSSFPSSAGSSDGLSALPPGHPELGPSLPETLQGVTNKPVLFLQHRAERDGEIQLAGHSSHSSHASHASHSSHYSGSTTPDYSDSDPATSSSSTTTSPKPKAAAPTSTATKSAGQVTTLPLNQRTAQGLLGDWSARVGTKTVQLHVSSTPGQLYSVAITIGRDVYVGTCDSISDKTMFLRIKGTEIGSHRASWIYRLDSDHFDIQHFGPEIFPDAVDTLSFRKAK